jgi:hypothetical protein
MPPAITSNSNELTKNLSFGERLYQENALTGDKENLFRYVLRDFLPAGFFA